MRTQYAYDHPVRYYRDDDMTEAQYLNLCDYCDDYVFRFPTEEEARDSGCVHYALHGKGYRLERYTNPTPSARKRWASEGGTMDDPGFRTWYGHRTYDDAYVPSDAIANLRVSAGKILASADRLSERGWRTTTEVLRNTAAKMLRDAHDAETRNRRHQPLVYRS